MSQQTSDTEILVMEFMSIFFIDLIQIINTTRKMSYWRNVKDELIFDYDYTLKEFWIRDRERTIIKEMFQLPNEDFERILKKWATENFKVEIQWIYELPF